MYRIFLLLSAFISLGASSQTLIPPYSVSVSERMTTNILFPYPIQKADIGTADVIGHTDEKLGNVLFLKANQKDFAVTNLSVYTSDGKFYSFLVQYKANPDTLNLSFLKDTTTKVASDFFRDAKLDSDASRLLPAPASVFLKTSSQQMKMILRGIYIRDQVLWFKMDIANHSPIDYRPESIRFYVRDRHTAKRTAVQENELTPIWHSADSLISGEGRSCYLYAFVAFTLDRQKKLVIELREKNGGRMLTMAVKPKQLLRAKP